MRNSGGKETGGEMLHGAVEMKINGVPAKIELSVPAASVKPQKTLPVLQHLTNSCVQISVAEVEENGKEISCRVGCGACRKQLIPISKIEAYSISKLVRDLPAMKKHTVTKRFENAYQQLAELGWFEKMRNGTGLSAEERHDLAMEYFYQGIACPFLENESCSIYVSRPLACREYLVTSPARNCADPTEQTIKPVPVSLPISATGHKVSAEILADGEPGFIPLISALKWCDDNPERFPEKTGPQWIEIIMENLTRPKQTEEKSGSA